MLAKRKTEYPMREMTWTLHLQTHLMEKAWILIAMLVAVVSAEIFQRRAAWLSLRIHRLIPTQR